MALKLTHYKSVDHARHILLRALDTPRPSQPPVHLTPPLHSPSAQQPPNGGTNVVGQNTSTSLQQRPNTFALDRGDTSSPIRYAPTRTTQRTPSPMINQPISAQQSLPLVKSDVARARKVEHAPSYLANGIGDGTNYDRSVESLNLIRRNTTAGQNTRDFSGSQGKVTITTNNSGAHSILICNDDEGVDVSPTPTNVPFTNSSNGLSQTVTTSSNMSLTTANHYDDSVQPTQKEYIEQLCNRVTKMLNNHPIGGTTTQGLLLTFISSFLLYDPSERLSIVGMFRSTLHTTF